MIQSFHTQLQVTLRALSEVVAPSVDPKDKQALEQLHLSIATLSFMQQRLPYARRYYRVELEHLIGLTQQVVRVIGDAQPTTMAALAQAMAEGQRELQRPEAEIEDYQLVSRRLRDGVSTAVADAAGQPYEARLDALIVNSVEPQLLRERAWCLPLGLELRPDELPSLDQLLDLSATAANR